MADENTTVESPVLDPIPAQPQIPQEPAVTQNDQEINDLVATLEQAGVTSPAQLQGKLDASQQTGQMANLLGEARDRISNLETQLNERPPVTVPVNENFDLDNFGENQPVNLEETVVKAIRKENERNQRETAKVQQQSTQVWGAIQNDPDYGLVQKVWEQKMQDPNFAMQIQSGRVHPYQAYQQTVRDFYKGIAQQSLETIKSLRGGTTPAGDATITAPHVETGTPSHTNLITGKSGGTTIQDRITEIKAKAEKNGVLSPQDESELADLVMNALR